MAAGEVQGGNQVLPSEEPVPDTETGIAGLVSGDDKEAAGSKSVTGKGGKRRWIIGLSVAGGVVVLIGLGLGLAVFFSARTQEARCCGEPEGGYFYMPDGPILDNVTLYSAPSCAPLVELMGVPLGETRGWSSIEYGTHARPSMAVALEDMAVGMVAEAAIAGESDSGSSSSKSSSSQASAAPSDVDFSGTNNQVDSVDEGDILKTDGRHIYIVGGRQLVIIDAQNRTEVSRAWLTAEAEPGAAASETCYTAEDAALSFSRAVSLRAEEALLDGGVLTVISRTRATQDVSALDPVTLGDIRNKYRKFMAVVVQSWNVSEPSSPALISESQFEGAFETSRMINGTVFIAMSSSLHMPYISTTDSALRTTVAASPEMVLPVYRTGASASWEPVAPSCGHIATMRESRPTRLVTMVAIAGSGEQAGAVLSLKAATRKDPYSYEPSVVYASQTSFYIASSIDAGWRGATSILAFDLSGGSIRLRSAGVVQGWLLNQFSMDEHEGHLRVATTKRSDSGLTESAVAVLRASDLAMTGIAEGLGVTETIKSVRFLGDRGYVVTFRQVDPLYVLDLSSPSVPAVLGELKITGYSAYLHPAGEGMLLGVGKEADENGWETGVKVSLFDVRDPSDPLEVAKLTFGEGWASSAVTDDHRAFLYRPEDGLMVLPVATYDFSGAVVLTVSTEGGVKQRGAVTHFNASTSSENMYWQCPAGNIKRSLYIGDSLWTLSDGALHVNGLPELLAAEAGSSLTGSEPEWTTPALQSDWERAALGMASGEMYRMAWGRIEPGYAGSAQTCLLYT